MKLLQILFLFLSIISFAQENEIAKIKEDYNKVRNIYENYRDETNLPNKYFHYHLKNKKENYFIHLNKKKYDSLIVLKLPDSIIINKSIYKIRDSNKEYFFYTYRDPKINYFQKYLENQLIEEATLYNDNLVYEKKDYKNLTLETYYFGEGKYPFWYKYQKFDRTPFDLSTNMIFNKIVLQDRTVKIYDYKKDFPLSDEEFLKKVPNIFAEQSVEMLKDGKKVKNFSKNTAKNVSLHMLGTIIKAGDDYRYNYKYELKKGYSSDDPSKPVYSFMFFTPNTEFWALTIDPNTEKLINIDYGKGAIY